MEIGKVTIPRDEYEQLLKEREENMSLAKEYVRILTALVKSHGGKLSVPTFDLLMVADADFIEIKETGKHAVILLVNGEKGE